MTTQMLWATTLQTTSFVCATGVRERTESPNFRFSDENTDSERDLTR